MNVPNGEYALYLRKSRADLDAEARGEGETLAKHKRILLAHAKRLKINITHIYQEIVSGDRISDRPEVMKLLNDVEDGKWTGVLVVEVERLARGDTIDQGVVAQAFKRSSTLIVTPNKIYDPNNEFDEEYFEFGLFMARREYKTITRRLQRGREASATEGNYIAARPPYGYKLAYDERGERYLVPDPETSGVVKMIFDWYVNGVEENGELTDMGAVKIARRLQEMGVPTYRKSTTWNFNVILQILRNEVYIGRIQWKKQSRKKSHDTIRKYDIKQKDKSEWIDVEGKHEPLIDVETFERASVKLRENLSAPVKAEHKIVNPMAGLIYCGKCQRAMVLKPFPKRRNPGYSLICNNKYCDCKSSNFDQIEARIIDGLKEWLKQYKTSIGKRSKKEDSESQVQAQLIQTLRAELKTLDEQKGTLFDFLERKLYDEATFLERSKLLSERIQNTQEKITKAEAKLKEAANREKTQKDVIPTIQEALTMYKKSTDQQRKNALMKSVLVRVEYVKEKHQVGEEFEIKIVPRIK